MPVIDYLVLAPLQQEWDAARSVLSPAPDAVQEIPVDAITYYAWAEPVDTRHAHGEYLVVAAPSSLWTPGPALAASVATKALERWLPRRVVLMGIAGSIESDTVRLGDVVVAAEVYGYEITDAVDGAERLRGTFNQPNVIDLNRAMTFNSDSKAYVALREACLAAAPSHGLTNITRLPELHLAVVGSGNR